MKFLILAFVILLSAGDVSCNQHEYRGYTVTSEEDEDLALCGTTLDGCLSIPTHSYGCKVKAQFRALSGVVGQRHKWIYQDGLLKPKDQPKNWYSWSSQSNQKELCLGPKVQELASCGEVSYKLYLQLCPQGDEVARHMRFILTDEGTVQSLAPVRQKARREGRNLLEEEEDIKYCMSAPGGGEGWMTLERCQDEKMAQQGLQAYGTVKPFVLSLQDQWGYEDVVELAYSVGEQDSMVTVSNYDESGQEEILQAMESSASSGILAFEASKLQGVGEYRAKLETRDTEYSLAFVIADQSHYTQGRGCIVFLLVVIAAAFVLVGGVAFCFFRKRRTGSNKQKANAGTAAAVDVKIDDMTETDDDDSDTASDQA